MSEIITIDDEEDDIVIDDSEDNDVIQLSDSDNDDIRVEEVMINNDVEFAGFHYNKYNRRRRRRKNRSRDETINKSGPSSGVKPKQEVTVNDSQESSNTESEVEVETIETKVSQSVPQTNPLKEINEDLDRTLVEENEVLIEGNNEEILDTNIEEINETLTENNVNTNIPENEVLVSTDSLVINETNVSNNFMPKIDIENQINDKIEKLVLENTVENETNDSETTDIEENILSLNIIDQIETNDFNNNNNSENIIIADNNLDINESLDCNDTENQNINNDINENPIIDTNNENVSVDENEDNYEIESLEDLDIGPNYVCSWGECGLGFDEAFDHYMHEKKHLRDSQKKGIKTFKCSKCEFSAFTLIDLTFHNTEHLNRYLCRLDNCRFQTNSKLILDIHSKKHKTGKCNECIAYSACDCGEPVCRRKKYKSSKTQIYKSYKLY